MRLASLLSSFLTLALAVPAFGMPHPHRGPTSPRLFKSHGSPRSAPKTTTVAGIAPQRATQIQAALIKSGYMSGEPSGQWDATTIAAVQKMQADNGWQTKLVPDSRAIIKLGLGPNSTASATESEGVEAQVPSAVEPNAAVSSNQ